MYAAKIKIGWVNKCFEGETPLDIIRAVEKYQEFDCLLNMGRQHENAKGQKELDKLEAFLEKYYNGNLAIEDIKNLEIHLGLGDIVCYGVAEGEEQIKILKEEQ